MGVVDSERLLEVLQKGRRGEQVPTVTLVRTMCVEGWLRNLRSSGVMNLETTGKAALAWEASTQG